MGQKGKRRHTYNCPDMVIDFDVDANLSNDCPADPHYQNCDLLMIQCLNAAHDQAITLLVSYDGTTYDTLQSGGSDVALTAGEVLIVDYMGWAGMKLASASTGETADRTFAVRAVETIG